MFVLLPFALCMVIGKYTSLMLQMTITSSFIKKPTGMVCTTPLAQDDFLSQA
jgi:K+-transporting ATPase A subunit